jgi:hypothetical protein
MFIDELRRELTRRRIEIQFAAHDLFGELAAGMPAQPAPRSA